MGCGVSRPREDLREDDVLRKLVEGYNRTTSEGGSAPAWDPFAAPSKKRQANAQFLAAVRLLLSSPDSEACGAAELVERIEAEAAKIRAGAAQEDPQAQQAPRSQYGPRPPPFGELEPVGLLGCGGRWGVVGLFEHRASARSFALKVKSKGLCQRGSMEVSAGYAVQEKLILVAARSPFVVNFYGSYNRPGSILLLNEPCLGGELHSTYKRLGLYGSVDHAKFYIACAACALRHLHSLRFVCRDIKPEEWCLDSRGWLKLVDLDTGKFIVDKTYTTCGSTQAYFAPEVIEAVGHDFAYDWWCVGILLYELMSGEPPFKASDDPLGIKCKVCKEVMAGIDKISFHANVEKSKPCKDLVMALCRPQPEERLPVLQDGWEKFQQHSWFAGLDWAGMESQTLSPPFKPEVAGPKDRSMFQVSAKDAQRAVPFGGGGIDWQIEFGLD